MVAAALFAVPLRPAQAQWHVGIELGVMRYGGSSHDTSNAQPTSNGQPWGGPALGVAVDRRWTRWGATLRAGYANPGFAITGGGLTVLDKTTGSLVEFSGALNTRVGGVGSSGAVWIGLGPALHLWDGGGDKRLRVGALAAAQYEWAVTRRLRGEIRVEGLLSPSWFNSGEVPPEYARRVTWRYGAGLGLGYRL